MNNPRLPRVAADLPAQTDAPHSVAMDPGAAVHDGGQANAPGVRKLTCRPEDKGASARDASPLKQNLQPCNCAGTACGVKRFATLQAYLALAGFSLTRTTDGYYIVARWNQTRSLETLEQVEQFHRRVAP